MRRLWALGICAALALAGCGDGGHSDSGATAPTQAAAPAAEATTTPPSSSRQSEAQAQAKQGEGSAAQAENKSEHSSPRRAGTVRLPPISSAPVAGSKAPAPGVRTVKGADDSVQTYGVEASEAARTEATIALASYLNDRLQGDWEGVCAALAQRPKEQLEKLAPQGKGGCAGTMAAVGEGESHSPGTQITEVLSFRGGGEVPGNPSYLIFAAPPGQTLYSMPMYFEAGAWKVGLAAPAELPL